MKPPRKPKQFTNGVGMSTKIVPGTLWRHRSLDTSCPPYRVQGLERFWVLYKTDAEEQCTKMHRNQFLVNFEQVPEAVTTEDSAVVECQNVAAEPCCCEDADCVPVPDPSQDVV